MSDSGMKIALLIDADNVSNEDDIKAIVDEIKANLGKIYINSAYADWSKEELKHLKTFMMENAITPEMQPQYLESKNSTDMKLTIDAMDILYTRDMIDTFCLVSGDSDFIPLVTRLKRHGKQVIGFGYKKNAQKYLITACDDFRYIEALKNEIFDEPDDFSSGTSIDKIRECIFTYLSSHGPSQLGGVKQTIKASFPDFDERNYGFSKSTSFTAFLNKSFKDDFDINNNIIDINKKLEEEKVKNYVVNYIISNGKKKKWTSAEIHNFIVAKFKSFRVGDRYSNMKGFLTSIDNIAVDKNGKYYYKG